MGGLDGLTAAVSGGAAIGDFVGSRYLAKEQNSANRALADEAFWREAKYNSPEEQMARLKAAGLNPNLVYGTGTTGITGNTHASIPSYTPGANPGSIVSNAMEKYLSVQGQKLNNDIAARTAKNLDVQNVKTQEEIKNLHSDNRIKVATAESAERENALLAGTFQSAHDPWYMRLGGRIGALGADMISDAKSGSDDFVSSPAAADRNGVPVRLEFDESQRSRYTPRKASREVVYKYK